MAGTISDVARKAGVGVGTVSRVINNSPRVSESTRRKVLEAMQDLDYVPNPFARRLSLGKALTLAIIAPFFTRPSSVERLRGVEAVIVETEYDLILYNVETVTRRDAYFRRAPQPGRIDGLIIVSLCPTDEDVEHFRRSCVPTVLVDAWHPDLPCVVTDDVAGGYVATRHLLDFGHRRIAFLGDLYPNPFNFTSSHDRYTGYRKALEEAGLDARSEYYVKGEHGRDVARELTFNLLSLPSPPTAIVAASDTQALGVMEAAREMNVPVPGSLSVVGYDDIEVAGCLDLTTVRQPLFESGWRGTNLLLQIIDDGDDVSSFEQMPVELVVRGTTAPPLT
jgi:DNA-binding LacI/PurR family transcriptional regulator